MLQEQSQQIDSRIQDIMEQSEIIIAAMGVTGSRKSSFIQRITQPADVKVGHSLTSGKSI
jgi:predicted GTPase